MADHHTSSLEDEVPKKRTTRGATKLRKLLLRNLKVRRLMSLLTSSLVKLQVVMETSSD